jgi:glutathione S-transferase
MFAALNSEEPPIIDRDFVEFLQGDKSWCYERMARVNDRIRVRPSELSARLGDADWLDGAFSAADILMVQVLRRLGGSGILEEYPNVSAYVARGEARPAYKRAFAAQLAVFTRSQEQGAK